MKPYLILLSCILVFFSCRTQQDEEKYTSLRYKVYFSDNEAGFLESSKSQDGSFRFVFEYNDRGRGPHLEETIKLNEAGLVETLRVVGHNYLKDSVNESFSKEEGSASWKSTSEEGTSDVLNAFYIGVNSTLGNTELLIRKMLKSEGGAVDLYPSGTATMTSIDTLQVMDSVKLRLIEYTGISFIPRYAWFDDEDRLFAYVSDWFSCVREGHQPLTKRLLDIQTEKQKTYYRELSEQLTQQPSGKVVIRNVSVFDSNTGELVKDRMVVLDGNKIDAVLPSTNDVPKGSLDIDGTGKTLLPGLFDMHGHLDRSDGILNIAAGVTSVRDLANTFELLRIRDDFDNNVVIGPRILVMCGFIDRAGPYAGPIGKIINSLEEGFEAIEYYKNNGYQQIKLYSSIDPSWVEPLAGKAHELGMRVSGHIPAFMLAEEAIRAGYDEIQHVNMLALNFMPDTIDTRTPLRFSMIGEQAHTIDIKGEEFTDFVKLLKTKDIVCDLTVSIYEVMLTTQAGEPDPMFEAILDRLPIQIQREYFSGGLPIPEGKRDDYKRSYDKLLEITYALYTEGITIVAGTDAMPGFGLHKELENYVKAGIPNAEVLRIATIKSAQVIGVEDQLGSIEAGKLADLVLVDGDPLSDMSAIRRTVLTIKNGDIYDSNQLYKAIGVLPYE